MSLEAWNRYVLAVIGLSAVVLYVAVVLWGIGELTSRVSKQIPRRKRSKAADATRRLPNNRRSG